MQYRKFGELNWKSSVLGFGCMRLPTINGNYGLIDQEKTDKMIWTAIDGGVNYFDTAYTYHNQQSEVALGKALAKGYRKKVRIATKLPVRLVERTEDFEIMFDKQLERLQTDFIDFYLMHGLNNDLWEKIQRLNILRKVESAVIDGRIGYLGFSFHDNLRTFKKIINEYDRWTFCQIQYNYMDINYQAGKSGLHYAANKGLAVVIMEPLRGGRLAEEYPSVGPIWKQAEKIRTPADWAFQWLWNQPEVTVVLSGMSAIEQVNENLVSADISHVGCFKKKDLVMINQVRKTLLDFSPIGCTNCEYCMPCTNGVNIPEMFNIYNRVAVYSDLEGSRKIYQMVVDEKQKARNCIQCKECLEKCPQNISISDWMPIIEDVLGKDKPYQVTP